jgi:peptidoglycan/LPS O-acetylase OafA/YrhL
MPLASLLGLAFLVMPICVSYFVVMCGLAPPLGESFVRRDISYGMYLIHGPVLVVVARYMPDLGHWTLLTIVVTVLTAMLAYLSRVLVEEPALRQKRPLANWIDCKMLLIGKYLRYS